MHRPCGHVCAKVAPFTWLLPMTTLTSTRLLPLTASNHHPNNNNNAATLPAQQTNSNGQQATWPAQQTNGYNRWQATLPVHWTNNDDGQQATSPAQQMNNNDGCATTSRQWQCMSSSLSVNLSEHHDSPPCLLYSHENQGATSPLATWQLTLGLLLLTTLPTPGLCPTSPLRASACRAAMGPFI